jgi:hypothetical protein
LAGARGFVAHGPKKRPPGFAGKITPKEPDIARATTATGAFHRHLIALP